MIGGMEHLRLERRDGVAVLTLDRPPANAMDAASLHELADAVDAAAADDDIRSLVITGAGRVFSAGLDLKALVELDGDGHEAILEGLNRAFLSVYGCPKLVVGAINGHVIAGGLVLAVCCDVRLVADVPLRASFAEVQVGVMFPVGALEPVRQEVVGAAQRRLVLRGETVGPAAGVELGLFDRVVPADELSDAALAEANATAPPLGFARIKEQVRGAALARMRDAIGGRDPLPRPWITGEALAAATATLAR